MIKIRLQRHGSRHAPFYRMVVAPSASRRDGRFIEVLGTYNPQAHIRTEELKLKMDRVDHWLQVGAQPTDTAKSLIKQGRLSPEEWLEKAEKKTKAKADRTNRKKAPVLEETEPIVEESAKKTSEDSKPDVKEETTEEPEADAKAEEAESESKEEAKEEAPEAEEKEEAAEEPEAEAKVEEAESESKEEAKEKALEAEEKVEGTEDSKAKATEEISEDNPDDVKGEKEGNS